MNRCAIAASNYKPAAIRSLNFRTKYLSSTTGHNPIESFRSFVRCSLVMAYPIIITSIKSKKTWIPYLCLKSIKIIKPISSVFLMYQKKRLKLKKRLYKLFKHYICILSINKALPCRSLSLI